VYFYAEIKEEILVLLYIHHPRDVRYLRRRSLRMASDRTLDEHLQLSKIANCDVFTGNGIPTIWGRLFGGQILAQSLLAAAETVPTDYIPNSLHAYFVRTGNSRKSIMYSVERLFSGRSFHTRRVTASQENKPIFTLTMQFAKANQPGGMYQTPPEEIASVLRNIFTTNNLRRSSKIRIRSLTDLPSPDEMVTQGYELMSDSMTGNIERITIARGSRWLLQWTRHKRKIQSDAMAVHMAIFAFLSDHNMVSIVRQPHEIAGNGDDVSGFSASLDHSIHFHRPFRVDAWHIVFYDTLISRNARGTANAVFFNVNAELLASTKQECLVRPAAAL
jgi:acyl-CoA thioesterase II